MPKWLQVHKPTAHRPSVQIELSAPPDVEALAQLPEATCGLLIKIWMLPCASSPPPAATCQVRQLTLMLADPSSALELLPRLTSLQELCLPLYNPPAGALAPVLSALTSLTKLFIHYPQQPEQQALPTTLKELTIGREHIPCENSEQRMIVGLFSTASHQPLPPLHISHLTALHRLRVLGSDHCDVGIGYDDEARDWQGVWGCCYGKLPARSVLPASLGHLIVKAVPDVQPLLGVTGLHTLTIAELTSSTMLPQQLLALTQLTSLTRVDIRGRLVESEEAEYFKVLHALPRQMPVLVNYFSLWSCDAGLLTIPPC